MKIKKIYNPSRIKNAWIELSKCECGRVYGGLPFQRYEIQEKIFNSYVLRLFRRIRPIYLVVTDDEDNTLIIAPLMLIRGRYHSLSGFHGADYYDFVYRSNTPKGTISEAFSYLLSNINKGLDINCLVNDSIFISILGKTIMPMNSPSIRILIQDYYEYFEQLKRHVRQNIRTAYNRLKNDNNSIKVSFYDGVVPKKTSKECMSLYNKRRRTRYKNASFFKSFYINHLDFITTMCNKLSFSKTVVLRINGVIAAYMSGVMDYLQNGLYVIRLAINDLYSKYSPGIILINESIKVFCTNKDIHWLDFGGIGDRYKKDMGGIEVERYKFSIS